VSQRATSTAAAVVTLSVLSGCSYHPASNITCEKIRALRIGMTTNEVRRSLGEPLSIGSTYSESDKGDEVMDYSMPPARKFVAETRAALGGVRLYVYFSKGQLREVSSYRRYPWSESQLVYVLDEKNVVESKLFKPTYCP